MGEPGHPHTGQEGNRETGWRQGRTSGKLRRIDRKEGEGVKKVRDRDREIEKKKERVMVSGGSLSETQICYLL